MGGLGEFLAGLLFYATNDMTDDFHDKVRQGYGHKAWFPLTAMPGREDFYEKWMQVHLALQDATTADDIAAGPIPATQTQRNAAMLVTDWFEPSDGVFMVLHGHAYATLESLFENKQALLVNYKLWDLSQMAYNYVMIDCLRHDWLDNLKPYLDKMNAAREIPVTLKDMKTMLEREDHLELETVHDLVREVEDSLFPFPHVQAVFESEIAKSQDPNYRSVLAVDFQHMSDPNKAAETASKLMDFLGDRCKITHEDMQQCIESFLGTIKEYPR